MRGYNQTKTNDEGLAMQHRAVRSFEYFVAESRPYPGHRIGFVLHLGRNREVNTRVWGLKNCRLLKILEWELIDSSWISKAWFEELAREAI